MKVEIILNDDGKFPTLRIRNCDDPQLVNISFVNSEIHNVDVNIEDLKLALRKIGVK